MDLLRSKVRIDGEGDEINFECKCPRKRLEMVWSCVTFHRLLIENYCNEI